MPTKLTIPEQKVLTIAKKKIRAIQDDMINSTGLTREEADLAAKVGLIAKDQRWWWTEEWQEGEREVEADIREGRVETFNTIEEFLTHLDQLSSANRG